MDQTLIIGLGNPDPTLEETYHNVGALAVQWIAEHGPGEASTTRVFRPYKNIFTYAKMGNAILIRPLVYMNESGRAVKDAMRAFGVGAKDIVVIHDDSDIPVGELKRAAGGGSAGHKGIQSIIDHIHTESFARIRIGIREPNEVRRKKAGDFVLSRITPVDKKIFEKVFQEIRNTFAVRF
jgi:PTH1 family peptidyl-tRNA hydrolase